VSTLSTLIERASQAAARPDCLTRAVPRGKSVNDIEEMKVREDERQACWEDFIQVVRNSIKDVPKQVTGKDALTALHEAVYSMGWQELGTGDGKPMHNRVDSACHHWKCEHGAVAGSQQQRWGQNSRCEGG
jgi:hypothetical protein